MGFMVAFASASNSALDGMVCAVRYVFPDEASAEASADGRSAGYVVARSEEEAAEQARQRCAAPCFTRGPFCAHTTSNPMLLTTGMAVFQTASNLDHSHAMNKHFFPVITSGMHCDTGSARNCGSGFG